MNNISYTMVIYNWVNNANTFKNFAMISKVLCNFVLPNIDGQCMLSYYLDNDNKCRLRGNKKCI